MVFARAIPLVARGVVAAAPKVAKFGGAALGGGAKFFTGGGIGATIAGEAVKAAIAVPILKGVGIIPSAPPPAPPPMAANAPGSMGRYALPSQAAWWDQLIFKGKVNETFGNPGGLEYQKYNRQAGVAERGQDKGLEGRKYTADQQLKGTSYAADQRLKGVTHWADQQLKGRQYTADQQLKGVDLTSGRRLAGTALKEGPGGSVDRTNEMKLAVAGLKDAPGGSVDRTNQSRVKIADLTSGRSLEGTKYKADATVKVADVTGRYKVETADVTGIRRIQQEGVKQQGQILTADTKGRYQVATAATTGQYKMGTEGVKQEGQIKTAMVKGDAAMGVAGINAEGKARVADLTGAYKMGTEGVKQQGQISTQYAKNEGAIGLEGAKSESAKVAYIMKSNDSIARDRDQRQFQSDMMNQQARITQTSQAQRASQQSDLVAEQGAQQRARDAHANAFRAGVAARQQEDADIAGIRDSGQYWNGASKRRSPRLAKFYSRE